MQTFLLPLNPTTCWHPELQTARSVVLFQAHLGDFFLRRRQTGGLQSWREPRAEFALEHRCFHKCFSPE